VQKTRIKLCGRLCYSAMLSRLARWRLPDD
jgi:hypothetical protein